MVDRGRFRTTPKAVENWFTDVPEARVAMEAGTHSIWINEQLQELGHDQSAYRNWVESNNAAQRNQQQQKQRP